MDRQTDEQVFTTGCLLSKGGPNNKQIMVSPYGDTETWPTLGVSGNLAQVWSKCFRINSIYLFSDNVRTCPEKHHINSCLLKDGIRYIIPCNSKNWYDARSYCLQKGGDLATLDTPRKVKSILDHITGMRLSGKCTLLFIGLHKEIWIDLNDININVSSITKGNE